MNLQDMAGGTEGKTSIDMPAAVQEKVPENESASLSSFEPAGDEPTEEERATLRHVPDKLPWSAFLVAIIELAERFTYYGLSGPFQNYIQNKYHPHDHSKPAGAIGMCYRFFLSFIHGWFILTLDRPWAGRRNWINGFLPILVLRDSHLGRYRFRPVSGEI